MRKRKRRLDGRERERRKRRKIQFDQKSSPKADLNQVAQPLQLPNNDPFSNRNDDEARKILWYYNDNDDTYKKYVRQLRRYDRFAWQFHPCWRCREGISAGDWYEARVYVADPPVFVEKLGRKARFWTEKYHYPECPDRLREFEEEMYARWEEEDRAQEASERKAA